MRLFRRSADGAGPGRQGPWELFADTERGATHILMGLPNQDSYDSFEFELDNQPGMVASVADGHGSLRHFRSAHGSRFAVEAVHRCVLEMARTNHSGLDGPGGATKAKDILIPAILETWRASVLEDFSASPFTEVEESHQQYGDAPEIAYGSTLLVAVWIPDWLLLIQIGDGDILVLRRDGQTLLPVPSDPNIYGHRTTSLCQEDAIDAFRFGIVDPAIESLQAVLLASDGYANSQTATPWQPAVGAEVVEALESSDAESFGRLLGTWVRGCASEKGSGDDTTVVIVSRREPQPAEEE
jgi:hypothetical protein